ncbi:MAG: phenylalanine--tRNA ligase subunit beta, partial [Cyclobacteriaceae bacterium]
MDQRGLSAKHQLTFAGEPVEILNKLSEEQGILRQTMLFTGLEVVAYNINRKQKDVKLFEFGKIYWKDATKNGQEKYQEEERLALYMSGSFETENWQNASRAVSYYDVAQQVAHILQKACVENTKQEPLIDALFEFGVKITKGTKEIGRIGKVKTALAKDFGIKQEIFYADLNTSLLFKGANPKFVVTEV